MHPQFAELSLKLKARPLVMGILNVTPDSFSDGGRWLSPRAAADHALDMAQAGADLVDIGGESTRPGATSVPVEEELNRVLPVIRLLRAERPGLPLSVDTQKAEVARRAVEGGACLINDVAALKGDPGMAAAASASGAGVCLMHRLETPQGAVWSPQEGGRYGPQGVTEAVLAFLRERLEACEKAGIAKDRIWLDPGLGFGKSVNDNFRLLKDLPVLAGLGLPLLVGLSRKSFIGAALGGLPIEERLPGTLVGGTLALWQGAAVLRVHDVAEAVQAVSMVALTRSA